MAEDQNQRTYSRRAIANYYSQLQNLQAAEQRILDLLSPQLSQMKMLDIGVGGGRTTKHFAHRVAKYHGIDYSAEMIMASRKRYARASQSIKFDICDARDMSCFSDNTFDFVLFSFNGVDYVSHQDRLQMFAEVHRVGKPEGYFCFSSHNLQAMERAFSWRKQVSLNPATTYVNLIMYGLLRAKNQAVSLKKIQQVDQIIVKDESHNFSLNTYYIRPHKQLEALEQYFTQVKTFSWHSGKQIQSHQELQSNLDEWLYYLCKIK